MAATIAAGTKVVEDRIGQLDAGRSAPMEAAVVQVQQNLAAMSAVDQALAQKVDAESARIDSVAGLPPGLP